ncbi:MAG: effector-associated constant component EACC1 [Pseudonocardiaceae bacterium]
MQSRSVSDPQLSISADDELRSLPKWLRREDTLRGRVRSVQEPVRPGQMGGALDALVVALGSAVPLREVERLLAPEDPQE